MPYVIKTITGRKDVVFGIKKYAVVCIVDNIRIRGVKEKGYQDLKPDRGRMESVKTDTLKVRCFMSQRFMFKSTAFVAVFIALVMLAGYAAYADPSGSVISGRLAATFDAGTGTVTAMVAGYCGGEPVTIGPVTWQSTEKAFSALKAEEVGKTLCGKSYDIKKIIKANNNGKGIVAEVLLVRQEDSALVGR